MDIVARLRKQAHICWSSAKIGAIAKDKSAAAMDEAAATIEALRAELAGRDAEIAAWLRECAARCRKSALVPASYLNAEAKALETAATAIASGAYRQGEAK